jgi:flagellar basal body-associated protein FliL
MVLRKAQLESSTLTRWIALICVLLALVMTGVEATHAHSEAAVARNSTPCAICLSAHAKAPTITVQLLPMIYPVETVSVTYESQGKSAIAELSLFIRPPPSV